MAVHHCNNRLEMGANTIGSQRIAKELGERMSLELDSPRATTFSTRRDELLQELGCELLKLVACELLSFGVGGR